MKLHDSSNSHDENNWSWEESSEDWEGMEEKKEEERKKEIDHYRKRKILEEKTARRVKHMLRLDLIKQLSIDYFNTITADYNLAKDMAVKEYMMNYLQFTE